jgi:hypothetical protein
MGDARKIMDYFGNNILAESCGKCKDARSGGA